MADPLRDIAECEERVAASAQKIALDLRARDRELLELGRERGVTPPLGAGKPRPPFLCGKLRRGAVGDGGLRGGRGRSGRLQEAVGLVRVEGLGGGQIRRETRREARCGLAAIREPFGIRPQPVERRRRRLAGTGGVRELLLGLRARGDELLGLRVQLATCGQLRRSARTGAGTAFVEPGEIERRDRGLEPRDLLAELLGPFGSRGLERQRAQALSHLGLDVSGAIDLERDAVELQLGPMAAELEPAEPRGLLDERAPLGRLRAENGLDAPLRDDRAQPAAETDVREQLDQVEPAHRRAVDEVLPLATAMQPT